MKSLILRILFIISFGYGLTDIISGSNVSGGISLCVIACIFPIIDVLTGGVKK